MRQWFRQLGWQPFVPAASVLVVLSLAWAWGRWGGPVGVGGRTVALPVLTAGWRFLMLVVATGAAIFATANLRGTLSVQRGFVAVAALADACGLLLLLAWWNGSTLSLADVLRLYLVLSGWLSAVAALTALLKRFGSGPAVALAGFIAAILLAAPVTLLPVVRAFNGPSQQHAVTLLTHACPSLAFLSAVKTPPPLGWSQMGEMYHLTTLGQDIPMELPQWWAAGLGYSYFAIAVLLLGRLERKSSKRQSVG